MSAQDARDAITDARKAAASPSKGLEKFMELFQQPGLHGFFRAIREELKMLAASTDVSTMDAFLHLATVVPLQDIKVRAFGLGAGLGCLALALGDCRTTATVVCTLVGVIRTSPRTATGFVAVFMKEWAETNLRQNHTWVRTCYRPLVQPIVASAPFGRAQKFMAAWVAFATMRASLKDTAGAVDIARTALDAFCDPRTSAEARGSMAGSMHKLLQLLDAVDAQRVAAIIVEETLLHASRGARVELLLLLEHLVRDAATTPEHFVMVCHVFATATVDDEQPIWLALFGLWIEVAAKDTSKKTVLRVAYLVPPVLQRHAVASTGSFTTAALLDAATRYAIHHWFETVDAITISPNKAGILTLRCHAIPYDDMLKTLPAPSGVYDVSAVLTAASALVAFRRGVPDDVVAYLDTCAQVWPEARGIVTPCFLYMASTRQHPTVLATLLKTPGTNQCTYCSETHRHVLSDCSVLKSDLQEKKPLRKGVAVPSNFNCSYCRYHELLEATGHVTTASTRTLSSATFHKEHSCNTLLYDIANTCVRVGYVCPSGTGPPKGWVNYLAGKTGKATPSRKHPRQDYEKTKQVMAHDAPKNRGVSSEPAAKRRQTTTADKTSSNL